MKKHLVYSSEMKAPCPNPGGRNNMLSSLMGILAMGCFFATSSLATSITNQELLKACKDPALAPQNFCYGFVIATANAAQFYRNIVDIKDEFVDICFPKNISNQELVSDYIAWVEKNPSVLESPAFIGVSSSFSTKYSCPPKKKKEIER